MMDKREQPPTFVEASEFLADIDSGIDEAVP
jgi:hypothetical protein